MKVFRKIYKFFFFWTSSGKSSAGCPKNSAGLSNCFLPLHGDFWKKNFLKSFGMLCGLFFGSFPVIEQETFGRPLRTAFVVSIKSFFRRKNWFGKQMNFFIIFRQWAGSFRLLVEFFDREVKTAFYVSKRTFQRRTVFFVIFLSFLDTERFFWPILAKK